MAAYAVASGHAIDLPGGTLAASGSIVELEETDAQPLVDSGQLVAVPKPASAPKDDESGTSARKKGSAA